MNSYLTPAITIVGMLISIAVMWGVLRTTVELLKEEVERLRGTNEKHESNLSSFREDFVRFREEARVWFATQLAGKMAASGPAAPRAKSKRRR